MVSIGRKLFAKIHKQKDHANPNHDVHFMARELDGWLMQAVQSMLDGSYTPRLYHKNQNTSSVRILNPARSNSKCNILFICENVVWEKIQTAHTQ